MPTRRASSDCDSPITFKRSEIRWPKVMPRQSIGLAIDAHCFSFDAPNAFSIDGVMHTQMSPFEALQAAVHATGGQSALARVCGRSQPAVWKWVQSAQRLPPSMSSPSKPPPAFRVTSCAPTSTPDLGPSPAWKGVDQGTQRVSFNQNSTLQERAA
jgi:hypothetical protein